FVLPALDRAITDPDLTNQNALSRLLDLTSGTIEDAIVKLVAFESFDEMRDSKDVDERINDNLARTLNQKQLVTTHQRQNIIANLQSAKSSYIDALRDLKEVRKKYSDALKKADKIERDKNKN